MYRCDRTPLAASVALARPRSLGVAHRIATTSAAPTYHHTATFLFRSRHNTRVGHCDKQMHTKTKITSNHTRRHTHNHMGAHSAYPLRIYDTSS